MKANISIFQTIKSGFKDFKKVVLQFFIFETSYKAITSFILIPFIIYLFNISLKLFKVQYLTNEQILNFMLSLKGFCLFTIFTLLSFLVIFIEIGVLIAMSEQSYHNYKTSILSSLKITLHRTPQILGIGIIPMIIFMIFLIPFEGLFIDSSIFTIIKMPKFISSEIENSYLYETIFIFLAFLILIIFIRYIFVFHSIIIENLNISKALKKSLKLTKGISLKLILTVFIWNILSILIGLLLTLIPILILFLINILFKFDLSTDTFIFIFVTLISIILFIYSFLLTPFNINIITKIYYANRKTLGDNINSDLNNKNTNKKLLLLDRKLFSYLIKYEKYFIFLFAAIIMLSTFFNFKATTALLSSNKSIKIISHRANCENEPENSVSAIKNSIKYKIDFAEIDVQESLDGTIVLMHDDNLKRLAGIDNSISNLAFKEIQNINVGKNYGSQYWGEKIPTLDEVVKISKGNIKLLIELKSHKNSDILAKKVVNIIESNNMVNSCIIHSLDYSSLKKVKELNPYIKTGYIVYMATGDITKLNVDFYTIEQTILTDDILNSIHKKNKEIFIWTVNTEENMEEVLTYNVDGIITDNPNLLRKIIQSSK